MEQTKHLDKDNKTREGLLLCMLVAAAMESDRMVEKLREITRICVEEPEFADSSPEEIEKALSGALEHLQTNPEAIVQSVHKYLSSPQLRQRGLEFAVRVVISDGIVTGNQEAFLETLVRELGLPPESLAPTLRSAAKRLTRFMILYLVYLTATVDGVVHAEEFEEMIPLALNLPVYKGVSTAEFARISQSVRRNLQTMKDEFGLDYITGTLTHAAEQLGDATISEQALRLVARGIFADGAVQTEEREFFLQLADRLHVERETSKELVPKL